MPTLTVLPEGVVIEGLEGEAMLDTIRRCGYKVRYGCRRGGCGRCKADLIEGKVAYGTLIAESVLSLEERAQGACLSCRAVPLSDVVLALRNDDHLRAVSPWPLAFGQVRTHQGWPLRDTAAATSHHDVTTKRQKEANQWQ